MHTDKEILEYSKQIVDVKTEIETSESAKPDLEDQIRTKFTEDSVNRAKFIDATLVIGAATKEFRNVFGVDAPHYEINKDCYYAIDENNSETYTFGEGNEEDERVTLHDPMQNNIDTKTFTDCWQMIDAARFDSTSKIDNTTGKLESTLPVERQHFFVDSKKAEKGSPIHQPICPPGYDKWAGAKIYSHICKNFDLTEPVLYKMLSNPTDNTIPFSFTLGPFDGDEQFSYNINEKGEITKEFFQYNYTNDSLILKCVNGNNSKITNEGCSPSTNEPIKWYTTNVLVRSTKADRVKKFFYEYVWTGTPFERSRTPMASFKIVNKKGEELNNGFVVLCLDPKQLAELPREGSNPVFLTNMRYCVHVIYMKNSKLYDGDNYDKGHKFLWWSWTSKVYKRYSITFNPIAKQDLTTEVKGRFADFVKKMENNVIVYYDNTSGRKIKNDIPDWEKSVSLIRTLYNTAKNYLNNSSSTNWDSFMSALRTRVAYDLYLGVDEFSSSKSYNALDPVLYTGKKRKYTGIWSWLNSRFTSDSEVDLYYRKTAGSGEWNPDDWVKIFSTGDRIISSNATLSFVGQNTYISDWESHWLPKWPRWLKRLFKFISYPVYTTYDRVAVSSIEERRNIEYVTEARYSTASKSYLGPSGRDLTRFFNSGNMTTRHKLVYDIMSENDRTALKNKGIISGNNILINGTWRPIDNTKIEVTYSKVVEEMPPYNSVLRAQKINAFLDANPSLYNNAFRTLSDRINKRTGTLRNLCVLLESTNINSQMIEQRKKNIANLFDSLNAYEITGGFGSNVITIKLAGWEPASSAQSNLSRLSTVYIVSDLTQTVSEDASGQIVDKFKEGTYVKTVITDIVDMVSDVQYTYEAISGEDLSKTNKEIAENKKYYVYDEQTSKYVLLVNENDVPDDKNSIFERSGISSGPIFNVTLQDTLPDNCKGRNPILVKVY